MRAACDAAGGPPGPAGFGGPQRKVEQPPAAHIKAAHRIHVCLAQTLLEPWALCGSALAGCSAACRAGLNQMRRILQCSACMHGPVSCIDMCSWLPDILITAGVRAFRP